MRPEGEGEGEGEELTSVEVKFGHVEGQSLTVLATETEDDDWFELSLHHHLHHLPPPPQTTNKQTNNKINNDNK